jgi:spoIIIJ-associated protein
VEWVETTGRTVAEAKDAALDELGVDEADAEFEVLAEPQHGLFGRLRSEARVRARVRPTAPRAKEDRRGRDRRRRAGSGTEPSAGSGTERSAGGGGDRAPSATSPDSPRTRRPTSAGGTNADLTAANEAVPESGPSLGTGSSAGSGTGSGVGGRGDPAAVELEASGPGPGSSETRALARSELSELAARRSRQHGGRRPGTVPSESERARAKSGFQSEGDDEMAKGTGVELDLDQQAAVAVDFLSGLLEEFGLPAEVTVARPDPDTAEVQLTGNDLGILIGPKGQTLVALQSLTRTVVFNQTNASNGHINVDVSGYRQKRNEALVRFAHKAADTVKESGQRIALEPMSAVDRKVIHDTIANIDGVSTLSEGEEPRRRVVVLPAP